MKLCVIRSADTTKQIKVDEENANWPASTTACCWHCCHTFDSQPVPLPLRYHDDVFTVQGCFCSFECCKAFSMSTSTYDANAISTNLSLLHKLATGTLRHIRAAPPRWTLRMFGGELDIGEFRCRDSPEVRGFPRNMIITTPNVIRLDGVSSSPPADRAAPHAVSFDDVPTNNEPLRLKRDKPLRGSKNSLERLMTLGQPERKK